MVRIKRKVKMTLPELIDWGFKNNIENKEFVSNFHKAKSVIFNLNGWTEFSDKYAYLPEDTFTVEVEEEVTEDTKLDFVLEIYKDKKYPDGIFSVIHKTISIKDILKYNPDDYISSCLYLVNEDATLTLIWKDGELV